MYSGDLAGTGAVKMFPSLDKHPDYSLTAQRLSELGKEEMINIVIEYVKNNVS